MASLSSHRSVASRCQILLVLGFLTLILDSRAADTPSPAKRPRASGTNGAPISAKTKAKNHPTEALKSWLSQLPPPPEGVSDLRFEEFFKQPVGPRGLDFSPRLLELSGKRVRILGYQVKQSRPTPWTLMLAPMPLISNEVEFGLAEDLPPTVVRVFLPRNHQPLPPHSPGLLLMTGRLETGSREEPDGRSSLVRLHLDREASTAPVTDPEGPANPEPQKPLSASANLRR